MSSLWHLPYYSLDTSFLKAKEYRNSRLLWQSMLLESVVLHLAYSDHNQTNHPDHAKECDYQLSYQDRQHISSSSAMPLQQLTDRHTTARSSTEGLRPRFPIPGNRGILPRKGQTPERYRGLIHQASVHQSYPVSLFCTVDKGYSYNATVSYTHLTLPTKRIV